MGRDRGVSVHVGTLFGGPLQLFMLICVGLQGF